ncbi:MAG: N-acetyl-gamma-glutamyl-phosphate reductase [bacterium]
MIKAAIVGAASLSAEILIRLLLDHPQVEIKHLVSETFTGKSIEAAHPHLKGLIDVPFSNFDPETIRADCDVAFLMKPHRSAMKYYPQIKSIKVIDISADFRIKDPAVYEKWYNAKHTCPDHIENAVYGLVEIRREEIRGASLVANPGCYPTGVLLGVAPAVKAGLVNTKGIIIDAVTGASGAGKAYKPTGKQLFVDVSQNLIPYSPARQHQHIPEIEQEISLLGGGAPSLVSFTPYVGAFKVGILSTIYLELKKKLTSAEIGELYSNYYKSCPFIRLFGEELPQIADSADTNFCAIGWRIIPEMKKLQVVSSIDNIIKGAGGQAIQNMNVMFGLDEAEGLPLSNLLKKK